MSGRSFGAKLPLAPLDLAAQGIEDAVAAEAHELDGMLGAVTSQFVADLESDCLLAVDGEDG